MKTKFKKYIKLLKGYLPVSRKEYMKDLLVIKKIVQGLIQAEAQHAQIEANLIKHMNVLTHMPANNPKEKSPTATPEKDVSIQ